MLEKEIAAVMKRILEIDTAATPYYWEIKEDFAVPSVFFPIPEVVSGPDTLSSFYLDYSWYPKFFDRTDNDAHARALAMLTEIRRHRNLIALFNHDGSPAGRGVRIEDPAIQRVDSGAVQMTINFTVRMPYYRPEVQKMVYPHFDISLIST